MPPLSHCLDVPLPSLQYVLDDWMLLEGLCYDIGIIKLRSKWIGLHELAYVKIYWFVCWYFIERRKSSSSGYSHWPLTYQNWLLCLDLFHWISSLWLQSLSWGAFGYNFWCLIWLYDSLEVFKGVGEIHLRIYSFFLGWTILLVEVGGSSITLSQYVKAMLCECV